MDIIIPHRDYPDFCRYWSRNESSQFPRDELVHNRIPAATFWSKEIAPENDRDNIINGQFMIDRTNVTIETKDNILGIKSKDLVEYQGEIWEVVLVQHKKERIQTSFFVKSQKVIHTFYIELRK